MSNLTTYPVRELEDQVDFSNSTEVALATAGTFTGEWKERSTPSLVVAFTADQNATVKVEFSTDKVNVDSTLTYLFKVGEIEPPHRLVIARRFYRVTVENTGGADMTFMRLQTCIGDVGILTSPLNSSIPLDGDATAVRPNSFADEVIIGRRTGIAAFTKFGYRNNLTAAGGDETIWAVTGSNFSPLGISTTFTIAYDNTVDGAGQTGARTLFIAYVDANGEQAQTTHTLGGTGSDVTSFSGFGINRVAVASTGTAIYNNADITITATTGGSVQAFVPALQSVTQQCIYHVGSNSNAVATFLFFNVNKTSGGGSPRVTIKGYVYNRNVLTRYEIFRHTVDSAQENTVTISEPVGFALSPADTLWFVADTDTNNTIASLRFSLREYRNT